MKLDQVDSLREKLDSLIHGLRELPELPDGEASKVKRQLKQDYHRLYGQLARVANPQINTFTHDQQLVIRSLEMGQEAFEAFHAKILPLITNKAKPTAIAIANFTKSAHAFELINKRASRLTSDEMDEVKALLGGMLGVEVGEEFVRSIKGEMMGRIIAYALSGLCEEDVAAFEALDPTRRGAPTRDAFLLNRIVGRSSEMVYASVAPLAGSNQWDMACTINEKPLEDTKTITARNRADTCIVNHAKGTIVFGSITSNIDSNKKQALSATRMYNALALMVQQEFVGGDPNRPNPYHGYKIEPFYFHTGLFPVEEVSTGAYGTGAALFKMLSSGGARIKKAEYTAIAQLCFFSLLGEDNPSASRGRCLSEFNVHLCGCDTLKLYHAMRRARAKSADEPRGFAAITLNALTEAAAVLGREGTVLSNTAKGQNMLQPALETVVSMAETYFLNFPVKNANDLLRAERDIFPVLSAHLSAISEKLRVDGSGLGNHWRRRLDTLADDYSSVSAMKNLIRYGQEAANMSFVWNEERHATLTVKEKLGLGSEQSVDRITQAILADFSMKKVPPVIARAIDLADATPGKVGQRRWVNALVTQAMHTMTGGRAVTKIKENANQNAFDQCFSHVRYASDPGHPAVTLVWALRPLFKKEVWDNRPTLTENPVAAAAVSGMVKELLSMDPEVEGYDAIMRDFAALAHPSSEQPTVRARKRAMRG